MRERSGAERAIKSGNATNAEREVRAVRESRDTKERERLRADLLKRAHRLLKGSSIELEEEDGEIALEIESDAAHVPAKIIEGFDLEALAGNPEFRTETRRVGAIEYVITERVKDRALVRPNGHGAYPEQDDLRAAMHHDFFMAKRWDLQGVPTEQAALIAFHYHRKPKEWLWRATEALLAAAPDVEPDEAVRRSGLVINGLIEAHRRRVERL